MGLFRHRPRYDTAPNPDETLRLRRGVGDLDVVGERHHAKSVRHVWNLAEDTEHVPAALVPEPDNPHDPHAVRVDLLVTGLAFPVGYIPAEKAEGYSHVLSPLEHRGLVGVCQAKVWKGRSGWQVYLLIGDDPEALVPPVIEDPDGTFVDGFYDLTVVGEESHQDFLSAVARTERDGLLFELEADTVPKGKYQGEKTYAVKLHGEQVGALTRRMALKHEAAIESVLKRGRHPYLLGRLEEDHRGWQAVLEGPFPV